jgi:hypothetical protein
MIHTQPKPVLLLQSMTRQALQQRHLPQVLLLRK